jgi:uncharacterized Zn-binding protein involved in type VI secretion
MDQVVVTYGQGDPKKGSVRMKPLATTDGIVMTNLGDYCVSRASPHTLRSISSGCAHLMLSGESQRC